MFNSRMKTVIQHDARDCGAACLAMIASFHGLHLSISRCCELTKTDKSGVNIYGLVAAAKAIGLHAQGLSGNDEDLMNALQSEEVRFPFVAHIISEDAMAHYIVVRGFKNGRFLISDPAKGRCTWNAQTFFDRFTGHIVTFEKTDAFQPGNETKGSFTKFFSLLRGQALRLAVILLISVAIAAIGIIGAYLFQVVIDNFSAQSEQAEVIPIETVSGSAEHTHDAVPEGGESETAETVYDGHVHSESADSGTAPADPDHAGHDHSGISGKIEMVVEALTHAATVSRFSVVFVGVIALYALQSIIQIIRGWLIVAVSKSIDLNLTLSYYNHLIDLPVSSIEVRQTGEYLSRFQDASAIREAISTATLTLLLDSIMVIACGVILYHENARMFAASLVMVLLYAAILLIYYKPVERANRTMMEDNARMQSYFKESIDGIETVKVQRAEEQIKAAAGDKFKRFLHSAVKTSFISLSQDVLSDTIEQIGTVIVLWIGFAMAFAGQITIGSVITFYVLLAYFTQPIKNLIELQPTIQSALVAADRLNDILDQKTEHAREASSAGVCGSEWKFENVDFRYGNREKTLHDVSLHIRRGEKIAIVGESGCGKTTLAKLLFRFYEPEQGRILVDNISLDAIPPDELRDAIAYISQNTFFFSDTIRANLCLGSENLTEEEILQACRLSRADAFIRELPLGLDTPIDENGANLSGGQRQRLAIARALLRKPQLLILDEATSNLDTITESAIRDAVFGFSEDIGCILIAHRLSTVRQCDRIYVMDKGRIAEVGTHDELIARDGLYRSMWNRH